MMIAAAARRQLACAGRATAPCRHVSFVTAGCWRSAITVSRRRAFCSSPAASGSGKSGAAGAAATGSGATPTPEPLLTRIRARVLSALQKDGGKELDTSLPLGATLRRIFNAATPELPLLVAAGVALVISSATSLIFPKAVGTIVDTIGPAAEPGASEELKDEARAAIRKMCLGLGVLFVVGAVASFGRVALLKLAGERLVARLRKQTFAALLRKDVAYFDARRSGDMLSKISADTVVLSKAFFECSAAVRSSISAIGGAGLLLYISPPLTALSLAVMPVVGVGAVVYGRYVKRLSKSAQAALGEAVGGASERLGSIRTVKLCNGEEREQAAFDKQTGKVYGISVRDKHTKARSFSLLLRAMV